MFNWHSAPALHKVRPATSTNAEPRGEKQIWQSLHYLNIYRVILGGLFVTSIFIEKNLPLLGSHDPITFVITSYVYMGLGIFSSFAIHWRWAKFDNFVVALALLDISCLTIVMHASGGIESGLGMLIVVAIAANSMLTNGKYANLIAALAAIAILAEQVVAGYDRVVETNYSLAGVLGLALFATAMLSYVLSRRLLETQALAEQRGIDLANMAQLNEHVIKRLHSGVIVVDDQNRIRLINRSAWHLVGLPEIDNLINKDISALSSELNHQLQDWKARKLIEPKPFKTESSTGDILPNFTTLSSRSAAPILIFLEDTARMHQQAQQMKLASLGRLTASIAHEIRNPLGAISHANQLLAESEALDQSDHRLTEIIRTHTDRVNSIIENVLQLSRRGNAVPQDLELKQWGIKFVSEIQISENLKEGSIVFNCVPADLIIRFDPTQLHQVVWNLCQNGLRYSSGYPDNPTLTLKGGILDKNQRPHLDIIDDGPGINEKTAQQIFEPFFTTDSKGSGLGLYIARELCELNQANLRYIAVPSGGCCFRIEFANIKFTVN